MKPAPSAIALLRAIERTCSDGQAEELGRALRPDDVHLLEIWIEEGHPISARPPSSPALELIRARPGITVPELGAGLGKPGSQLRSILAVLARQRLAHKHGEGWYPTRAG